MWERYSKCSKFSPAQKLAAVEYYLEHGRNLSRTVRSLGYPSKEALRLWCKELVPEIRKNRIGGLQYTEERKKEAAIALCTRSGNAKESYILGNWEGIRNQYEQDYIGCSAEGHVSHILSARLSSRSLGWSKTGVDQMARLRAFEANGGVVYDLLLARKRNTLREARNLKMDVEILKQRNLVQTNETLGNISVLNKGKKTLTAQFLRSIRTA